MPAIANPRKAFNFVIEIDGMDAFEAQKVTRPEYEIDRTAHGDANKDVKTAGRVKIGDMKIEKLRALPTTDLKMWQWLRSAQNSTTGGGSIPAVYKKTVVLKEMDESGTRTAISWLCTGVWPFKSSQTDFDRMTSDNIIETIEFSVDDIEQLPV